MKTQTVSNGARTFLPRAKLHPDPDQPRKDFGDLSELAESLAQRIEQNLIVRPHPKKPGDFLIVDGERRWRAAALKKIERLPVEIRQLTDEEAHRHQLTAGTQRANLSALEAADALLAQFKEAQFKAAGRTNISFDSFAASLGIKRSTAYNRRALAKAPPNIRAALAAGKLDLAIATLVLTVQPAEKQAELLKEITNEKAYDYPFSYRAVQEMIEQDYRVALKDAAFDRKKIYTGAECVPQPCETCAHRTGNMTEAHPELKASPHVCTLPTCFRAKTQAHTAQVLNQAKAEGRETMSAELYAKARHNDYQEAGDKCYQDAKNRTYGELAKKAGVKTLLTVDEDGKAIEVIPRAALAKIKKANNIREQSYGGCSAADAAKAKACQKKEKEFCAIAQQATAVILEKQVGLALSNELWKLVAWGAYRSTDIDVHSFTAKRRGLAAVVNDARTALQKYLRATTDGRELARLTVELLVCAHWQGGGWHEVKWSADFQAACKLAGVNLEKLKPAGKSPGPKSKPARAATRKKGRKK